MMVLSHTPFLHHHQIERPNSSLIQTLNLVTLFHDKVNTLKSTKNRAGNYDRFQLIINMRPAAS